MTFERLDRKVVRTSGSGAPLWFLYRLPTTLCHLPFSFKSILVRLAAHFYRNSPWTSDLYIWNPVGSFQVLTYFDLAPFAMIVHSHILKEFCLLTYRTLYTLDFAFTSRIIPESALWSSFITEFSSESCEKLCLSSNDKKSF